MMMWNVFNLAGRPSGDGCDECVSICIAICIGCIEPPLMKISSLEWSEQEIRKIRQCFQVKDALNCAHAHRAQERETA